MENNSGANGQLGGILVSWSTKSSLKPCTNNAVWQKWDQYSQYLNITFFRERCTYKTTYKEKCADEKRKVCEKFWKEDGYGGKVWTEDPSKCHWLQESECTQYPEPVKVRRRKIFHDRMRESGSGPLLANRMGFTQPLIYKDWSC